MSNKHLDDKREELKSKLLQQKLKDWDDLPAFGLYMDQVINFLKQPHTCIGYDEDNNFTRSMINNYIKQGLLPHCDGKKYSREHLAYLVAISLLKQVMSISDVKDYIDITMRHNNTFSAFYRYRDCLNESFDDVIEEIDKKGVNDDFLSKKIVEYAAKSYAYKSLVSELLKLYKEKDKKGKKGDGKK